MANNRMTEGVGKKIVEALKMQNDEMDMNVESTDFSAEETVNVQDSSDDFDFEDTDIINEAPVEESFDAEMTADDFSTDSVFEEPQPAAETPVVTPNAFSAQSNFENHTMFETPVMPQATAQSLDEFEVPSNVAVLKQLITKLPAGVTKQTGALIIKQTMEALGISMKSVLQEAQQVQEGLNNSTRECQASISEYKRQIGILEKQAQKYQRQYAALNDIISLFVQTNF